MKLPYEIADMCKKCIARHLKQKGKFEIKCTPVPKNMEVEGDAIYPLDKVLGEQTYASLPEEVKVSMQLSKNKLLWAKECLGWSPYNKVRKFYQFYQREYLLCTAKNKVMRFGRRLGKCVEENSLITTYNRGPIKAKYLNHNDEILTFDETTKKITHTKLWTKTDNGVKECVEITTETGKKDIVTTNHPYYVYRNNNFEWIKAEDIKQGDLVYIAKNYKGTFEEYESQKSEPEKFKMFGNFISLTNKKIPTKVFKCSLTNIAYFINGLFDYDTEKTKEKIVYSTTSHELAIGLKHLLVRFGIHAYLITTFKDYKLVINLKEKTKDCEKVISVIPVGERKTFSISVVDTHTFITNDIVTHNTEGMVIDILHFAINNPRVKVVVVAPFLNLTTEIFNRMEMLLSGKDSIFKTEYSRKKQPSEKIKLSNGSEINGFTTATDGKAIRGQSANKVYIDEGAYIPEEAYQVLMAFKLDNKDVAFNVASTPSALETKFKDWCLTDTHWKEMHYPSSILPDFHENDEPELRNSLTIDGYQLEVEAEFIEGSKRVFKSHNVSNCKSDYNYINSRSELSNPHDWYITIGCDWNEMRSGIQIVVLGFNYKSGGKKPFKVLKRVSMHGDFSGNKLKNLQTAGVEEIKRLTEDFKADYVYVDQGHGSMQAEVLSKYFYETNQLEKFKAIDFSAPYEMEDVYTGQIHHKRRKVMMVYFLQKRFELEEIEISEKEESGKSLMIEQLMLYNIDRYDSKGQPIFKGEDHILDALMLAVFAFIENYDSIFDKRTGIFVASFSNNIGRFKDENLINNNNKPLTEQEKVINSLTSSFVNNNSLTPVVNNLSRLYSLHTRKKTKRGGHNFDIF